MPDDPKQLPKQTLPPQKDPAASQAGASSLTKPSSGKDEQHVSVGRHEQEPIAVSTGEISQATETASVEAVTVHPAEVKIAPELKNIVENGPDAKQPKIDNEISQAGVQLAKESLPLIHTPVGDISLPMTYAQALQKKSSTGLYDSMHWLAALVLFQLEKYDPTAIHGKTVKQA